ncbi:MAG TPA: response regulator, partial [Allocoleopsis sp.]
SPPVSFPPSSLPTAAPAPSPQGIAALQRVLDKFRNSFTEQVAVLQQANIALQEGILSLDLKQQARQEAHKLAGSLGIFGYPNGSKLAREAEYLLLDEAIPLPTMQVQFAQVVAALHQEVSRSPDPISETQPAPVSKIPRGHFTRSVPVAFPANSSLLVLVIDSDQAFTEQLQVQAGSRGMQVEVAPYPDIARRTIAQTLPDVVLLDLSFPDTDVAGMALLVELTQQHPTLPVLIFTGRDSLADRVEISRLGAKAFLHKSMSIAQILQTIEQVLLRPVTTDAKVLIVDDDPASLMALSSLLQPWGLAVTTLTDPRRFWDMLVTTEPDLVVFDLEMPTFSGIDLCQVVRHDPQWGNLPILVVTAHT